jgi:hypothetical protein
MKLFHGSVVDVQTTYQGYDLTTPQESPASSEGEEEKYGYGLN